MSRKNTPHNAAKARSFSDIQPLLAEVMLYAGATRSASLS
jgi:hypothetical protein